MTSNRLSSRRLLPKSQISHKRTYSNGEHHKPVVRHEKQPIHISIFTLSHYGRNRDQPNSHDEKTIKHLHGIQSSQGDLPLPLGNPSLISAYKQG